MPIRPAQWNACLLTATTDDFLPGTFTMLHSFLQQHPDFDGDIVVIEDGLSDASREILAASFRQLRFEPVSLELKERVARLCALHPELTTRKASFHFLEAFRLSGYGKLFYCDGDLLFRDSIKELLDSSAALLCCADQFALRGERRDALTYLPVKEAAGGGNSAPPRPTLADTFNCGFLVLDERLMNSAVYADLLRMVAAETWRGVKAVSTDQLVLNRYFAGRQTLVSSTYNYLVPCAADIRARQGIDVEGAKVLHFKLPIKPWSPQAMLHWARPNPTYAIAPGFKLWYEAYVQCLAGVNLRHRLRLGATATPRPGNAQQRPDDEPRRQRQPASPTPIAPARDGAPSGNPRLAKICLATATSDDFVPGTLAMLGTFLKCHPRFDGDILVLHDGLSDESRRALAALFEHLRFEAIAPELKQRLASLSAAEPKLRNRLAHFYSIEAFRLSGYRKVLFCDSDLLFRASVEELLDAEDALICCGDSPQVRGLARDAVTYLPAPKPTDAASRKQTLQQTFNSGLLVIDAQLTRPAVYADLLAMLTAETWANVRVSISDQLLLNRYFAGRQTLVSSTYNYLIVQAARIQANEGIDLLGAKVLHFQTPHKPWRPQAMLKWAQKGAAADMLPSFKLWYNAYMDCLANAYLQNRLRHSGVPRLLGKLSWTAGSNKASALPDDLSPTLGVR